MGGFGNTGRRALTVPPGEDLRDEQDVRRRLAGVFHPQGQGLGALRGMETLQVRQRAGTGQEVIGTFGRGVQDITQLAVLGHQHVTGGQGLRLGKLAHDELADVAGLGEGRHRDLVLMGQRTRHVGRAGRFAVAAARQDQQRQKRTHDPQETVLHQSSPPLVLRMTFPLRRTAWASARPRLLATDSRR